MKQADIYSFINSKDIGDYCRKINHKFTALESAYLIWRSNRRSLKERHLAWKELIKTTPDTEIPNTEYKSLHEFLNSYMNMEDCCLKEFFADDNSAVYSPRIYTDEGTAILRSDGKVFSSIKNCFDHVIHTKKLNSHLNIDNFSILKTTLNRPDAATRLNFNFELEPLRIIHPISKSNLFTTFCSMCPIVPIPFEKGDVVKLCDRESRKISPEIQKHPTIFVIDTIGYWEINDCETGINNSKDYNAILYSRSDWDDNTIAYTQIPDIRGAGNSVEALGYTPNYLDLEYYRGEFIEWERILKGVSNYLKGNINLSFLLNTHAVMNAETNFKNMIIPNGAYGWDDTFLNLGGWTKKDVAKFKQINDDMFEEINYDGIDEY